ncbi:MAG TPA: NADH-quinone oxidoreductase subunit NuoE [Candidatus Polarisedimenticolia bacterium]|nr:NADH-quinone oxidoreductase subunit NuoE [Candidatus Polarisedimenticolia bacterium]
MSLTKEERQAIAQEAARMPSPRAACLDALRLVQERRGHVPDDALREVASILGMSEAELDAVATFYNLIFRRPVGRHVVLVCESVSCWIMGCERLREALSRASGAPRGGTSPDGRFTLLPIQCLGDCDHAPALMVDEDLHREATPEGAASILARYP